MDVKRVFFALTLMVVSYGSQCSVPDIVSSPTNANICQQGSLSYTCSGLNAVIWTSSVLTNAITVIGEMPPFIPPLNIAGVTLVENHNIDGSCINSTLTFIQTSTSLAALNGTMLICGAPGVSTDMITIVVPAAIYNPSPPVLMNTSSSCDCNGSQITLQWTPPNETGGQDIEIEHYLLNITGQAGYACPPEQCNVTTNTTTITGLQCNTSYIVSVRAVNCNGIGNSSKFVVVNVPPIAIGVIISSSSLKVLTSNTGILNVTPVITSFVGTTNSAFIVIDNHTIITAATTDIATTPIPSNMHENINLAVVGGVTGAFFISSIVAGIVCYAVCCIVMKHNKGAFSPSKSQNKMDIQCNGAYGQVPFYLQNSTVPVLSVPNFSESLLMHENECYSQAQTEASGVIHPQENVCYGQAQTNYKHSEAIRVQENVCYSESKAAAIYESILS